MITYFVRYHRDEDQKTMIMGDHTLSKSCEFDGMISGNLIITDGAYVTLEGVIGGNLTARSGAIVRLEALVGGKTINEGGVVQSNHSS